jgi:squalene cyclase
MSQEIPLSAVRDALQRAQRVIVRSQQKDGSWDAAGELGVTCTSQVLIARRFVGDLSDEDAKNASRWIRKQQRQDGSFAVYPFAKQSDLGATAIAWAGLSSARVPENQAAIQKARTYLDKHGGLSAIIELLRVGDLAPFFVSIAGLLDANKLPKPPLFFNLTRFSMRFMEQRFNGGVLQNAFALGVIIRHLRGEWKDPESLNLIESRERKNVLAFFDEFQNPNGSWNNETQQVSLMIPALKSLGFQRGDGRLDRALHWLRGQEVRDRDGLHYCAFSTSVWSTSFDLRALLYSGTPANDPSVVEGVRWLINAQLKVEQPPLINPKPDAPKSGGWGFQADNLRLADCDDAAVAMSALALALNEGSLPSEVAAAARASLDKGRDWLFGMQNPDGGWSAYVYGMPGKPPGPIMTKPIGMPLGEPLKMLEMLIHPPVELGEPSTEDLTSRVLHCLGLMGYTTRAPEVQRAVAFLEKQQCPDGSFWGRWVVNYLSGTAFVLMGLRLVGVDPQTPFFKRALQWVISHQNSDGGWGERPESYADPSQAGLGHSTPPLTSLVLCALLDSGEGNSEAVQRGIRYLLSQQRKDGTWLNAGYLHSYLLPNTFYYYPEAPRFYGLEALGKYLSLFEPGIAPAPFAPRYTDALLDEMRQTSDPEADAVIASVFASGQIDSINNIIGPLFSSDDPVPDALPKEMRDYFAKYDQLPSWADRRQIEIAQQLFVKYGWEVAMALFCSSLPQAYAAKRGAHVLVQTHATTDDRLQQRIFETAQFIFDVMDPGSFGANGRGIPAALKVRLMHASIRYFLNNPRPGQSPWDTAFYGVPVNQEDLVGTLMTFSCITLDALRRLELPVTNSEAEAWVHAWNVVGYFLGVQEKLLPDSVDQGEQLMDAIRRRQWAPSEDGAALTHALLKMMQLHLPDTFDGIPVAILRFLAGNYCADLLDVPRVDWTQVLLQAGGRFSQLLRRGSHQGRFAEMTRRVSHLLMQRLVTVNRGGKQAQFRIPTSLQNTVNPDF